MTALLSSIFAQTGIIGKAGPGRWISLLEYLRDVCIGSNAEVRQISRNVSCSSDSGHIPAAKQKIFTGEYLNSDRVWKWSTTEE
jgi:hypothetical protein